MAVKPLRLDNQRLGRIRLRSPGLLRLATTGPFRLYDKRSGIRSWLRGRLWLLPEIREVHAHDAGREAIGRHDRCQLGLGAVPIAAAPRRPKIQKPPGSAPRSGNELAHRRLTFEHATSLPLRQGENLA